MKGLVFDIQRYSIHDGPGIRTIVFLKGCPLSCEWCCNPESQHPQPEIEYRESLCQHCGRCITSCPKEAINANLSPPAGSKINRVLCDVCGQCVEVCPSGALNMIGKWFSVEEMLAEVMRDASYYRRSGGGVTISGGEPLVQQKFTRELLQACYERDIHTAVETCGFADRSQFEEILPFTDLFLFDVKHMDNEIHKQYTGVSNEKILENVRYLSRAGAAIILRVPLVPGINVEESNLRAIAKFASQLNVVEVHLMPFHQLGKEKYTRLGRSYKMGDVADLQQEQEGQVKVSRASEIMRQSGLSVFVGG